MGKTALEKTIATGAQKMNLAMNCHGPERVWKVFCYSDSGRGKVMVKVVPSFTFEFT